MRAVPQFGEAQPGRAYPDRPAAFAVVSGPDGMIATVRVEHENARPRLDLPGGGVDAGETAAQAAVRECGEEVGLRIEVDEAFEQADHYFQNIDGGTVNTRGQFFAAQLIGEAPELKIEDDHTLIWMPPEQAVMRLSRDSHAWAVAAWLRRAR